MFWSTGKLAWTVLQSGEQMFSALQGNSFGPGITASNAQMVSSTACLHPSRIMPLQHLSRQHTNTAQVALLTTHGGQVALQQGFCGEALPSHAHLDCVGVVQGSLSNPHAPRAQHLTPTHWFCLPDSTAS